MAEPPSRNARDLCWTARDAYFGCLDAKGVLAPGEEGRACLSDRKRFEKDCAKSWVEYFAKKRVMEARQRLLVEQSDPSSRPPNGSTIPQKQSSTPPPSSSSSNSSGTERLV